MSKKILFLFLSLSLLALNRVQAREFMCYRATDINHQHPLGNGKILGSLVRGEVEECEKEFESICKSKEGCIFKYEEEKKF